MLRQWLRVCDGEHGCYPGSDGLLPTRVLDVRGGNALNSLHLHCTKQGEKGRYVALSHRWGEIKEDQKFCAYNSNIRDLRKGIDFSKLPKTFQDAVTVTRELGVQYLWIDSLCIIQDNAKDWEAESKRMEDVFSSAYCTIAASSARDSTEGFLGSRPSRQYIKIPWPQGSRLYIGEALENFNHDVEEAELNRRGWVLQERALSRRTIHFTANQTYWECGLGIHCETLIRMRKYVCQVKLNPIPHDSPSHYIILPVFCLLWFRFIRVRD